MSQVILRTTVQSYAAGPRLHSEHPLACSGAPHSCSEQARWAPVVPSVRWGTLRAHSHCETNFDCSGTMQHSWRSPSAPWSSPPSPWPCMLGRVASPAVCGHSVSQSQVPFSPWQQFPQCTGACGASGNSSEPACARVLWPRCASRATCAPRRRPSRARCRWQGAASACPSCVPWPRTPA